VAQPLRLDRDEVEAELCRRSLPDFIAKAWPLVEPDVELSWNWHLDALCEVLAEVSSGAIKQVILNVPPGTGKSVLLLLWCAWEWASEPGLRYLTASYSSHLTVRDNLRLRAVVKSPWYQRHYPLQLSSDQNAKERFDTTASGWRIATSVGGAGTGEHPDRIVIDDPLSAEQARSAAERERAQFWIDRTISSRGVIRDVRKVLIMQRLHQEDTTGHLLLKGDWHHVRLPMHFSAAKADRRDRRERDGELLWPSMFDADKVRKLEIALGPVAAAGQLEQDPVPEGGGLFKREWFKLVPAGPAKARRCRGWDTAATEGGGDWTAAPKLALTDTGEIYVENVVRAQVGPAGLDALMLQTAKLDGREVAQREGREPGASGKAVIAARAKLLAGYDYAEETVSGDKTTRAMPFRAQCEAGNVYLVTGPDVNKPAAWIEPYLQVLESFPTGRHDDDVDGSSTAYNSLIAEAPHKSGSGWLR